MAFEVNLPHRLDVCTLRCAGMEVDAYLDRSTEIITEGKPAHFEVTLPYYLSDPPATVSVTMLESDKHVRLRIDAASKAVERDIRQYVERYSVENDGEAVSEREHQALWKQINAILKSEGMTYDTLSRGESLLNRRTIEGLMKLARTVERPELSNLADLFANGHVVKADRELAVRWLIELFKSNPDPFDRGQLSLRIWENAVPAVGDEIVKLVENRKLGETRSGLLMALARTKHPRATEVIGSVLNEPYMGWAGIDALTRLKATGKYVEQIRRLLRDSDSEVRRKAKKALQKLGVDIAPPPPAVHRVKGRKNVPAALEEWSANVDMDEVEPILRKLAKCIDKGFGPTEIAETIGVVEDTPHEQTRVLRFPITSSKKRGELWIVVFMDDVDSPDFAIHADGELIKRFERLKPAR